MLKESVQTALNKQLNAEVFSSYLYLSMAAYFESVDLRGMATWMRVQAQEELVHVMKLFSYINDRDGRVQLAPIAGPPVEWKDPIAAFGAAHEHECKISRLINDLVDLAARESDHPTYNFLQWFVTEQIEEEANTRNVVGQLKLAGDSGHALMMLDRELGQRVFVMPAGGAGQV